MQTALLDSYSFLPLAASLLIQGLSGVFLFKIVKNQAEQIQNKLFLRLAMLFVSFLGISSVATLLFPSLLFYASGILLSSIFLLIFLVALFSYLNNLESTPEDVFIEPVKTEPDPLIEAGKNFLSHVAESITGEVNLVRLLDYINQTQIENTNANGGVIFLTDDFDDIIAAKSFSGQFPPPYKLPSDLPHKPVRVETNFRYAQFALGDSIFGEVTASGKPVLIEDGKKDNRIFTNGPEPFLEPGSYIFVPLMVKDRVVGVSGLSRLPSSASFTEDDLNIAITLSGYAGAAINNVYSVQEILERADLEREASIASQIQKTLHPKRLPELPEVGFGAFFNSTKGVCGDYYDIILARRDRIAITIADVAGKGIQSSMVMIMLRSILHLVTNTTKSAGTILDWVNKGITGKIDMDHYASLAYLSYSPAENTVEYASAGHQPLLLWKESEKSIKPIYQKTDPIGIERSSVYSDITLTVSKGDIIILFTDGLIEALNKEGKQYGMDTLAKVISENTSLTAKDIAAEVKHNIQAFIGSASLHDDQTLVVMKIKS